MRNKFISLVILLAYVLSACSTVQMGIEPAPSALPTQTLPPLIPTSASAAPLPALPTSAPATPLPASSPALPTQTLLPVTSTIAPLILFLKNGAGFGDLWTWSATEGNLQQATTWGYNFEPTLSPTGQWVAYLSVSQAGVDYLQQHPEAIDLRLEHNIWLLNAVTGEAERIADQPPAAATDLNLSINRSTPSWSPDGTALGWLESRNEGQQLAVYDIAQKSTRLMPLDLPPECCEGAETIVNWGPPGIALERIDGTDPSNTEHVVYLYNPQGKWLARVNLNDLSLIGWLTGADKNYLGAWDNGRWVLVDPLTGVRTAMPGAPELYSVLAPAGLSAAPADYPYGHHLHWRILNGPASLELDQVGNIALSPDGQQVAYQQGEQPSGGDVFVYREGRLDLIQIDPNQRGGQGSTQKLLWGPMAWRVLHTP